MEHTHADQLGLLPNKDEISDSLHIIIVITTVHMVFSLFNRVLSINC